VRALAGYTGALLYNNGEHATTFVSDVSRSVLRTLAKTPDAPGGGGGAASDDALRRLTAEVRADGRDSRRTRTPPAAVASEASEPAIFPPFFATRCCVRITRLQMRASSA
jgi:hypothetical protein